ncbi:MAG: hypothetical protein DRQ88_05485 [Epsilonproteobacteria bacterium]|nr:MAG: hypothetical protein DRQ89_08500 [Campylobacterota bacterium]RLA66768.1 MAG: hypothetical protein DRQ88_05485 [Campylobacterota bacterium]
MLIDNINLNLLRIFEVVYRTKSMTAASHELFMTQSGVSQNIRKLEDLLQVKLFDRIKQRPVPTKEARRLFEVCSKVLMDIENSLLEITGTEKELSGNVSIGIPIEFGNNLVLPKLVELGKKHPRIVFHLVYGHAASMNDLLLRGKLDFAFVDDFKFDPQINTKKIHDEILLLCALEDYVQAQGPVRMNKDYFEKLDYVDYMSEALILKSWFKHHFKISHPNLNIRAALMDVTGMSQMIKNGLGAGIIPKHVQKNLKRRGHKIYIFKGSGKPLQNPISIAWVENRTQGLAVKEVFDSLVESFSIK